MIPYYTLFTPAQEYVRQLEQMIALHYRNQEPSKAEPFQHELQEVIDYNSKTFSAFYPIYMENENGR